MQISVVDGAELATGTTELGRSAGSMASALVSGPGSIWTSDRIEIGMVDNAVGSLSITNGGTVITGGIDAGFGTKSLILEGGTLDLRDGSIGDVGRFISTHLRSGTLRNVEQLNGGTGPLTKKTTGLLAIEGNNGYTGATLVNEGTLRVVGTISQSSGVTVSNGARFEAASTQALKKLTVNNGGLAVITPGAGNRLLDTGALTLAGATNAWTGKVDITNNNMIVHSTGAGRAADYAARGQPGEERIKRGRHALDGQWDQEQRRGRGCRRDPDRRGCDPQ